jgi:hypothetical protein
VSVLTEVEIVDMREYPRMIRPGFIETMVRVTFRTTEGYTGIVEVPKAIATEDKIQEEIRKSVTGVEKLIGTKLKI